MGGRRWCLLCAALLCAALLALLLAADAALVALVDPFEIYHRALFYDPPYDSRVQAYSNAGIARHYDYDGVIAGSSVTENCMPSDYDAALGGRFVKLCMNGGTARDHAKMLGLAFREKDVRRVVYGLDLFGYSQYYTVQRERTPDYLYDDSVLNDAPYWFNRSVLFTYIPQAFGRVGPRSENARDWMYVWDAQQTGADALAALVDLSAPPPEQEDGEELAAAARENAEQNLLPFVRAHRETTFYVFFPPYSLLYWAQEAREGRFEARLAQKDALCALLLAEPNVRLYDFQRREEWVADPSLYSDLIHYASSVNREMAGRMREGDGLVSSPEEAARGIAALRRAVYALFDAGPEGSVPQSP